MDTTPSAPTASGHHHVEQVMGMPVTIDIRDNLGARGQEAIGAVVTWLHDVNQTWSTHRDDSMITRFGRGEIRAEALPAAMHEVLDHCEMLRLDTEGAFDIHVPSVNGTWLETSGYVKGWAIQHAAEMLESFGASNFCVNAGGDIAVRGEPEPGRGWRVGIRHPEIVDRFASTLELRGTWAVATSGNYERGRHITDPRTGKPAEAVRSVTILGKDLTVVDVYATALFVMGVAGFDWLLDRPDYEAFVITLDDHCISTPGFDDHVVAADS